jgi:hypothetical protein
LPTIGPHDNTSKVAPLAVEPAPQAVLEDADSPVPEQHAPKRQRIRVILNGSPGDHSSASSPAQGHASAGVCPTPVAVAATLPDMAHTSVPTPSDAAQQAPSSLEASLVPAPAEGPASYSPTSAAPLKRGTKPTLLEKFPDLRAIVQRWAKLHEAERDEDKKLNFQDNWNTFRNELKRTREEFEDAGLDCRLPKKVSICWFCNLKKSCGVKNSAVQSTEGKRASEDSIDAD